MDTLKTPSKADLRKAQEALNALNVAYEYFAPLPYRPAEAAEADYLPFGKAA